MRDNDIAGAVKDLKQELERFKNIQLSGSDIYTSHIISKNEGYDFTIAPHTTNKQVGVTYTSNKQKDPYAILYLKAFTDSIMTNEITIEYSVYANLYHATDRSLYWIVACSNNNSFTVYAKLIGIATDKGKLL